MTKICAVAIHPDEGSQAVNAGADVIEFRLDLFPTVPSDFSFFTQNIPTIVTFRGCEEVEIYEEALASGATYADIERDSEFRDEFPGKTICSLHDFNSTPLADTILDDMADLAESGIPKAAYAVSSIMELISLGEAAAELKAMKKPFILIGMGSSGRLTRVRADYLGSMLTYVSLGKSAAPGEFTLEDTKRMTLKPMVTGIIGNASAVEKSKSPSIHAAAFSSADIPGIYLPFSVKEEEISAIPKLMTLYGIDGLNVTMPHKQSIVPYLSSLSPEAKDVGAVNTIDAALTGYNTDIVGVGALFAGYDVADKKILIIGAGGAARAACAYLARHHAMITITNRTMEKAEELARTFGGIAISPPKCSSAYDAVVLASPVSPVDPQQILTPATFVADMVYSSSSFADVASKYGCRTVDGKIMLIAQASESFFHWTRKTADINAMMNAFEGFV